MPQPSLTRLIFTLALPVLAEELLNYLVGSTDWFLAGHFLPGTATAAAMGLMAYILWILPTLFSFLAIGTTAVVARHVGAGETSAARQATNQALLLGGIWSLAAVVICLLGGSYFIQAVHLEGEAADLALRYLRILIPIIPAMMLEQVGTAALRGAGDTVTGLVARVVMNLVNMVVSTALVTGFWIFPKLGWEGLAIGTALGHLACGAIILAALLRKQSLLHLNLAELRFDAPLAGRILRVGIPGGSDACSIVVCHLIYFSIISRVSEAAVAAHGLGLQIESLAYLSGSAFQVAAATLAGQALGAKNTQLASRSVAACAAYGIGTMTAAAVTFYLFGQQMAEFYVGHSTPTTQLTGSLMKIVALGTPFLALLMVLSGALRGAGDTRFPLLITLAGYSLVRLPLACYLAWDVIPIPWLGISIPGQGLGVHGAWWAMICDVAVRSLLLLARYLHGGWLKVKV